MILRRFLLLRPRHGLENHFSGKFSTTERKLYNLESPSNRYLFLRMINLNSSTSIFRVTLTEKLMLQIYSNIQRALLFCVTYKQNMRRPSVKDWSFFRTWYLKRIIEERYSDDAQWMILVLHPSFSDRLH